MMEGVGCRSCVLPHELCRTTGSVGGVMNAGCARDGSDFSLGVANHRMVMYVPALFTEICSDDLRAWPTVDVLVVVK
jgi:hypothetical protein